MNELTLPIVAAVAGSAFLAAFAQGVTGFGSALVAMPLLALVLEVRVAALLVTLLSLAVNLALLLPVRRALPWRPVAPLLAGSLAGIPVGVVFLAGADPRIARAGLGAALVVASAAMLGARRLRVGPGVGPALAAGALAGLLGGAFTINGPVAALAGLPFLAAGSVAGWAVHGRIDEGRYHLLLRISLLVLGGKP